MRLAALFAALGLAACARTAEVPDDESSLVTRTLPEASVTDGEAGADAGVAPPGGSTSDAGRPDAGGQGAAPDAGAVAQPDAGSGDEDAGGGAADAGAACVAGTYEGVFAGTVQFLPTPLGALLDVDIEGSLEITVEADALGSVLVARNGKVRGSDQDGNPVEADLTGSLDCASKKLVNGKLVNGQYTRGGFITTSFSGTVEGAYVADPPSASGTWKTSAGFLEGGGGTWSATHVP